jgi:hypothetical protein
MDQYNLDLQPAVTAEYPQCELCYSSLRRPCTLAWRNKKGEIDHRTVCGACFKIAMVLGRMVAFGFMEIVDKEE